MTYSLRKNDSKSNKQKRQQFWPTETTCHFFTNKTTYYFLSSLTSSRVNPIQHEPNCRPGNISSYIASFHVCIKIQAYDPSFVLIFPLSPLSKAQIHSFPLGSCIKMREDLLLDKCITFFFFVRAIEKEESRNVKWLPSF